MRLGAANLGGKARPLASHARQMQSGGIDQSNRVAHFSTQAARRHTQHVHEKSRENCGIANAVGVGEGRARRDDGAGVIKPRSVARHRCMDVAQRMGARQLGEQQRYKLMLGLEATNQIVGSMGLHEFLENVPGDEFQYIRKNSIRVAQSADPFRVRRRCESPNTARILNTGVYKEKMSRTTVARGRA